MSESGSDDLHTELRVVASLELARCGSSGLCILTYGYRRVLLQFAVLAVPIVWFAIRDPFAVSTAEQLGLIGQCRVSG